MTLLDQLSMEEAPRARPQRPATTRPEDDSRKALAVLMQATRAVLGEIGGNHDQLQRLLAQDQADLASVAATFDALPGWQRAKIAELAQAAVLAARR